jgi:hypothetical protein
MKPLSAQLRALPKRDLDVLAKVIQDPTRVDRAALDRVAKVLGTTAAELLKDSAQWGPQVRTLSAEAELPAAARVRIEAAETRAVFLGGVREPMDNLKAIDAWKNWSSENENYAGDVSPADPSEGNFWFREGAKEAARHFHVFATGGDGSMIAVYSKDGASFAKGPVVHLSHEGEVYIVAEDVPHALGVIAASGENYEMVMYGEETEGTDEALSAWLKETFDVKPPNDPRAAVKSAGEKLGLDAVQEHIRKLVG